MRNTRTPARFALAALLAVAMHLDAQPTEQYALSFAEGSRLWLEGDSTFHAYKCEAEVLKVDSEIRSAPEAEPVMPSDVLHETDEGRKLTRMILTVPIKQLTSHIPGLAGTMRKALKYKEHPNIVFTMRDYRIQDDPEQPDSYRIVAHGDLSVAGVTRPIEIEMSATIEDDHIAVTGQYEVLMTDYDVDPPTAMFGAIKAANEVVIHWDLKVVFVPKERRDAPMDPAPDAEKP